MRPTPIAHLALSLLLSVSASRFASAAELTYPIVDTMQDKCYDLSVNVIDCPAEGEALYGQNAQYPYLASSYQDNGDKTVTDLNTKLLWQKTPDYSKYPFYEADAYCASLDLGGRSDWRLPTLKELYSLVDSRGELLKPDEGGKPRPYLDTEAFDFEYPNPPYTGQYWSSTRYVKGPIINDEIEGAFGMNFADGHIKGYPTGVSFIDGSELENKGPGGDGKYVRCVAGTPNVYGVNDYVNNGDGTVTDKATARMWQQADDGAAREWSSALAYCEGLDLAGHTDWRLPNTKELHSIVDYDKTEFPAINTEFFPQSDDSSAFWTSTNFGDFKNHAVYIAFGKALSRAPDVAEYTDWHGAGAQRSTFKTSKDSGLSDDGALCSENACDYAPAANLVRCVRYVQ
ncbi:DUF1566 domain-containing protein [Cohaesibacter celericrescens]|nr:DUF1566 domain-containing protein [Cohaesibacter celericrescens]